MSLEKIFIETIKYFSIRIRFKCDSFLMLILSYILFFNKTFMTKYTTTIGSTIYFPNEKYIRTRPLSSITIFLHELVHIYDSKRLSNILYSFLYLLPISLLPFTLLLFIYSWKIALVLSILCLIPLPAYFRMYFERRAYMASLYVINALATKFNFNPYLEKNSDSFISQFKGSSYYFMWVFPNINKQFADAVIKIKNGERPYKDDKLFDMLDQLISKVETISQT